MTKCQFPTQIVTAECHGRIHIYIYNSHQSLNPWKNWRLGHIQTPKMVHKKQQHNPFIWFSRVQKNLFDNIVYIYINLSIYLSIHLSTYLSIYLSIYLGVYIYIYIACFLHVCILHCIVYIHEFHHFHWFFNAVACFKKRNIVFSVSRWFFLSRFIVLFNVVYWFSLFCSMFFNDLHQFSLF